LTIVPKVTGIIRVPSMLLKGPIVRKNITAKVYNPSHMMICMSGSSIFFEFILCLFQQNKPNNSTNFPLIDKLCDYYLNMR
jgi:hypothetical protein